MPTLTTAHDMSRTIRAEGCDFRPLHINGSTDALLPAPSLHPEDEQQ